MQRYSRQIILKEIRKNGQRKLLNSKVVIIGCGALGTVSANNLARSGVGKITVVDRDIIELNNLQRQILFDEEDVGKPKAEVVKEKLQKINSEIEVVAKVEDVNYTNVEELIKGNDLVLDATDNMETRFLLNDACVKNKIPFIYGGAIATYGMAFVNGKSCFRCIFPKLPKRGSLPTCDTFGILNTVPCIIASIQITEALKILLGKIPTNDLIIFDVWNLELRKIKVSKAKNCPCCVKKNYEFLKEKKDAITSLCGRSSVQINPLKKQEINLNELAEKLKNLGEVKNLKSVLNFNDGKNEMTIFKDGRAIVKTKDEKIAKSVYSKYVGN